MITNDHIATVTSDYLAHYPGDKDRLRLLLDALDDANALATRERLSGHATASAYVVDNAGRVLFIEHKALGTLLQPGGHTEPEDQDLIGAARREVGEETGLTELTVMNGQSAPVWIDIHTIPHSVAKNEPEHDHYDFQFVFTVTGEQTVTLQDEEVDGYQWVSVEDMPEGEVKARLTTVLAT
ncbi:NUDIX hydrolase [Salininema proteolyticum]|uniref:NUDIX hydrolase n=1 Tax=Salininema proteolyticum TaxID=1607685 RepID=A0ABV8U3B4_9ACTN